MKIWQCSLSIKNCAIINGAPRNQQTIAQTHVHSLTHTHTSTGMGNPLPPYLRTPTQNDAYMFTASMHASGLSW